MLDNWALLEERDKKIGRLFTKEKLSIGNTIFRTRYLTIICTFFLIAEILERYLSFGRTQTNVLRASANTLAELSDMLSNISN
jgi:hypothetical protein